MPVLVLAWLGVAAAPCVATTASTLPHAPADGPAGHGSVSHGEERAGGHHHSHGSPRAEDGRSTDGRAGGCPHCPEGAAGHGHHGDSHTSCVPAEDASSQRERSVPPKLDVKHAIPPEQPVLCGGGRALPRTSLPSPQAPAFHGRPLNLRYCVFLN